MCEFCNRKLSEGHECGKDYPIHPCANGDLGVRAQYLDDGIVLYKDRHIASGYFDVNYCPICGRRISLEGVAEKSDLVPLNQVLCDMHNPDGGERLLLQTLRNRERAKSYGSPRQSFGDIRNYIYNRILGRRYLCGDFSI